MEKILLDVRSKLVAYEKVDKVEFIYYEKRPFSVIYEVKSRKGNFTKTYILKISTTSRLCEKEYEIYKFLQEKQIKTIKPVFFSCTFNYILTVKEENLIDFNSIFRSLNTKECEQYIYRLGVFLGLLHSKTKSRELFDSACYREYILSRLALHEFFCLELKKKITNKINLLLEQMNGKYIESSLVSDFNFCNIFLKKDTSELLLLDMGDAEFSSCYKSITLIYLNFKFGNFQSYFWKRSNTKRLFFLFIKAYGKSEINHVEFTLYLILHLINMAIFAEQKVKVSKNIFKKVSYQFELYKYKFFIIKILKNDSVCNELV